MLHTEFGLQRLQSLPRVCLYTRSHQTTDPKLFIVGMTVASQNDGCQSRSCSQRIYRDLRSESNHMSAPIYRTATAPLTGCGHKLSHSPAVRVWDAARLGESVQSH